MSERKNPQPTYDRVVRETERKAITGICRSRWHELTRKGEVPGPIKLAGRSVGWRLSELQNWVASRPRVSQ